MIPEYILKDHLGNSRVMFCDIDNDGIVTESEIIQEDHYYPFGLKHEGYGRNVTQGENFYQFNGTEKVEDFDLAWHHTLFRSYDPTIGRWHQIDPKNSARESGFVGLGNNPILFSDMLGDTIRGVNKLSATRFLEAINETFAGTELASPYHFGISADGHTIEAGILLNKRSIRKIKDKDVRTLAIAYYKAIKYQRVHVVEMINQDEIISEFGIEQIDTDTKRPGLYKTGKDVNDKDYGGKSVSTNYFDKRPDLLSGGSEGSYNVIVMNPTAVLTHGYTDGVKDNYFSAKSLPGELLAHELLGHGIGRFYFNASDGTASFESIQMGNLYLRMKGYNRYRDSHGVTSPEGVSSNGIPYYFQTLSTLYR
jgi:RHS repeat-associated protein